MLRNTLLLFFTALIISASAQHTRITLDASNMRMTTPKSCLSMDSTTVIELINVNPATQKVTITGKNVRVYTEPSGKVGDFIGFPASNTADAKADVNAAVGQKPTTKETEQQQSETRTLLEEMKEQNNKLLADQKKLKEELNKIVSRPVTTDIEAIKNLLADYAKGSKRTPYPVRTFATTNPCSTRSMWCSNSRLRPARSKRNACPNSSKKRPNNWIKWSSTSTRRALRS